MSSSTPIKLSIKDLGMQKKDQRPVGKGMVEKLPWIAPGIQVLPVDHIKQQEEEILYQLSINEDSFRLLTGSIQGG